MNRYYVKKENTLRRTLFALLTIFCLFSLEKSAVADTGKKEVVVYTSVDDVFARPIAEMFTKNTGIPVKLVPDTEETKSTGLLNRLIAEKKRPQADVFWSGDPVRAEILKSKGISESYHSPEANDIPKAFRDPKWHWTGFSTRARVLLYNTKLISKNEAPKSIMDLSENSKFKGKGCIANPLFGTTSMHAAAIFVVLGDEKGRDYFKGLTKNKVRMVSSNGEVRRRVSEGDCAVGITDTDDAYQAVRDKKPVKVVFPDENGLGTLLVPNVAVLIARAPNQKGGKKFIDFLLKPETEKILAESDAAQMPLRKDIDVPSDILPISKVKAMSVDYQTVAKKLEEISRGFLKEWARAQR